MERPNPKNNRFKPMKMFLRKQLEKKSFEKWGGKEGLEEEKKRREEKKREDMESQISPSLFRSF